MNSMKFKNRYSTMLFVGLVLQISLFANSAVAADGVVESSADVDTEIATEFDPFAPDAEEMLKRFDQVYEREMGIPSHIDQESTPSFLESLLSRNCYRRTCKVWARVEKDEQRLYLYVEGTLTDSWSVSTGVEDRETPDFDRHPNGRIYDRYTSTAYPEGDYNGLGNMPYAVFISGGFALHGTPRGNWKRLGHRASHGCVRQHPNKAFHFNRLVRFYGIQNVWITIQ